MAKAKAKPKPRRVWVYAPKAKSAPLALRAEVQAKADELIETVLRPKYVPPPPKDANHNYLSDVTSKWHSSFFYFVSTYVVPGPNALVPSFEAPFARMKHVGGGQFNLSFMGSTDEWCEVHRELTVDQALAAIRDEEFFHP